MSIIREQGKWNKATRKASTIFLMAHKNLDLDALGSCIGAYLILKKHKKKVTFPYGKDIVPYNSYRSFLE